MKNLIITKTERPFFSIITPSYNMIEFLPSCYSSVSDQNVDYEHIVVDAASTDSTVEWLKNQPNIIGLSEKDDGMYDAINKGLQLATGEVISYLNCDEQYLPGVLQRVGEIFNQNPRIDILFGNTLLIRPNGMLLAYRKSFAPRWPYVWASHLYVHSSSMFVRRRVFESGVRFDKNWKMVGDMDFVIQALRKGFLAHHVNQYFSTFMLRGGNLGLKESALDELKTLRRGAPLWLRSTTLIIRVMMGIEKVFNGAYWEKMPLSYSIYTVGNVDTRSEFVATSASAFYPRKGLQLLA